MNQMRLLKINQILWADLYWLAEYISANPDIKTHELETFKFGVKSKTSNITLREALKSLCGCTALCAPAMLQQEGI